MNQSRMSLCDSILQQIQHGNPLTVWTANDFAELGEREAVDKALQRLVANGALRRIERGLYDLPRTSTLTGKPHLPDYREVLAALKRRDKTTMLVDGMTAANDLGLTTAVPAKIVVHTNSRRRDIQLGKGGQKIEFRLTAPSKLVWADRPAMRLVQALNWLREEKETLSPSILNQVKTILEDGKNGSRIRKDLLAGFKDLPGDWMRELLRPLLHTGRPHGGGDR